jgi:nucleotide-binding universal stress UspA family protein/hemerythrin-like domain-containing protein
MEFNEFLASDPMYRHLLVPVDDTDLSIEVVASAVDFAASAQARVTFFHAAPDREASLFGDADALRLASPADCGYDCQGGARELLAKAEAAARAWGVPCESMHAVSDTPASAIVAAARSKGCDLIFIASHGSRSKVGVALASDTVDVLMHAGLPVLVAATGALQPPGRAIAIIRDEHRSLSAALHAWMRALAMARAGGTVPAPESMRSMVRYIERFKVDGHHRREEEHLFKWLRARTSSVDAELDELERQHERDRLLVADLAERVEALEAATSNEVRRRVVASLEQAVTDYASFIWEHLGREEAVILPAARRFLTDADWMAIEAAFGEKGRDEECQRLFSRIVDITH